MCVCVCVYVCVCVCDQNVRGIECVGVCLYACTLHNITLYGAFTVYVCHGMVIQGGVVCLVFHNSLVYVLIDMCLM